MDDTTYALLPGTFGGGGTKAIVAGTDRSGVLRRLTFVYDGSEPWATKVATYTARLGAPRERRTQADGGQLYVWQDAATRFELHFTPRTEPTCWARLVDRQRVGAGAG